MTAIEFNSLVTNERSPLRQYAYQLTKDIEDANDLLQETMLKAFTYREKFTDSANIKGWLYTIMKNSFINNYRRMVKRKTFIDQTDNLYFIDSLHNTTNNLGESKYIIKDIEKAIESLPKDVKDTFMMNFNGYKYHEISEIFNVPIGTVKTRIFVARRMLKAKLKVYGDVYKTKNETI
ncbi:MAG: RNA polymerase sigma factor [Bacteroidetes bacterium]|nr:RNA polymerase sigma factor [Bacteroidota bacterium]